MHVQNILETSEPRQKQKRRPEPWKHTKDPFGYLGVFNLDLFGTVRLFFENFRLFEILIFRFFSKTF